MDDHDLIEKLRGMHRFYTPLVSDTMERLGIQSGALHHSIQAILPNPRQKACGLAFPARVKPTKSYIEIHTLLEMVDAIPEHAFVIVSADAEVDAALWGGMMSARAKARGAVGAVVNGGVRDIEQIADLDFPTYGTYRCIKDIRRRGQMAHYNVPVYFGGVTIVPGDIIFADANGVLAIPREKFDLVYGELERALTEESATHKGLIGGGEAKDMFDRFGRF